MATANDKSIASVSQPGVTPTVLKPEALKQLMALYGNRPISSLTCKDQAELDQANKKLTQDCHVFVENTPDFPKKISYIKKFNSKEKALARKIEGSNPMLLKKQLGWLLNTTFDVTKKKVPLKTKAVSHEKTVYTIEYHDMTEQEDYTFILHKTRGRTLAETVTKRTMFTNMPYISCTLSNRVTGGYGDDIANNEDLISLYLVLNVDPKAIVYADYYDIYSADKDNERMLHYITSLQPAVRKQDWAEASQQMECDFVTPLVELTGGTNHNLSGTTFFPKGGKRDTLDSLSYPTPEMLLKRTNVHHAQRKATNNTYNEMLILGDKLASDMGAKPVQLAAVAIEKTELEALCTTDYNENAKSRKKATLQYLAWLNTQKVPIVLIDTKRKHVLEKLPMTAHLKTLEERTYANLIYRGNNKLFITLEEFLQDLHELMVDENTTPKRAEQCKVAIKAHEALVLAKKELSKEIADYQRSKHLNDHSKFLHGYRLHAASNIRTEALLQEADEVLYRVRNGFAV